MKLNFRIYLNELRKIFSLRVMLIVGVFFALSFAWFESFEIDNYDPNNSYSYEHYYSLELIKRYGATLEPDEFDGVMADYDELVAQANDYIASKEVYAKFGIHNYKEWKTVYNTDTLPSGESLFEIATEEEFDELMLGLYYNKDQLSEKLKYHERFMWYYNTFSQNDGTAIFSAPVMDSLSNFVRIISIFLPIFISLAVSPLLVTENLNKMRHLQYHTHMGRKLLRYQLIAMISSAWILSLLYIFVFLAAYIPSGSAKFWNVPLQNFRTALYIGQLPFDWTLGEYILVTTGFILLLITGLTMILFFVSKNSDNYISLIVKMIPITAIICWAGFNTISIIPTGIKLLARAKYIYLEEGYQLIASSKLPSYNIEFIVTAAVALVIGITLSAFAAKHEKLKEILN